MADWQHPEYWSHHLQPPRCELVREWNGRWSPAIRIQDAVVLTQCAKHSLTFLSKLFYSSHRKESHLFEQAVKYTPQHVHIL